MATAHKDGSTGADGTGRREFLKRAAQVSALAVAQPLLRVSRVEAAASAPRTLLKNGLIVDGSGKKGHVGDLLVEGARIAQVSATPIAADADVIDCTDKVVAPGFIDVHSHMDWILPMADQAQLKSPFTAQGCTTFVAGNCGFAPAGFRKDSTHMDRIRLADSRAFALTWHTMEGYYAHLREVGLSHNLVNLAAYGTTRTSIRGLDATPLNEDERKELLGLLEEAMDQGARGVSFGLQYEPGIFATPDEVKEVARLVKKKDKIVTVHGRAYSNLSTAYPIDMLGKPHNVLALEEMVEVARETGVRVQYSHLMFAGTTSQATYGQCLDALDKARADGVDIMIDTYPYHCGFSVINVFLSPWFLAKLPDNYHDEAALKRLEGELMLLSSALGFGFDDIQITQAYHPELDQYNGLFLAEIAEKRGISPFEALVDISEKSKGRARVLNHNYSNMAIIDALMAHPACLFMTDSVVFPEGVQNPASFGTFPLLLQYARDRKTLPLEQAVRKMTGANAERLQVRDRGFLKEGLAADITVFDWNGVKDNNTVTDTGNAPTGIEAVFMNGKQVKRDGRVDDAANAGVVVLG